MPNPTCFICYSRKDIIFHDELVEQLEVLRYHAGFTFWSDIVIEPGRPWREEIREALDTARAAILLLSPGAMTSDFILGEELPRILERESRNELKVFPVYLRVFPIEYVPVIEGMQLCPVVDGRLRSLEEIGLPKRREFWVELAEKVYKCISIDLHRPQTWGALPETGAKLFGRDKELQLLNKAWSDQAPGVLALVAQGGVGKTTLVSEWLRADGGCLAGCQRILKYSFYRQGAKAGSGSADDFIRGALKNCGDPAPEEGSPWSKGERLADLVQRERTLLILDGLETLQTPFEEARGRILDPALDALLHELGRSNTGGLCLVTSRKFLSGSTAELAGVQQIDLERISAAAGRDILCWVGHAQGSPAELEAASKALGNHALAVTLLAAYLRDLRGHDFTAIKDEVFEIGQTVCARGDPSAPMLAALERYWERKGGAAKVQALRLLGFFDRPATEAEIRVLRQSPGIPEVSNLLSGLSDLEWMNLLSELRERRVLGTAVEGRSGDVDAHPIVRQYFAEQIRTRWPKQWKEGHKRLYEHYRSKAKVDSEPTTISALFPLCLCVMHGCQAGLYREAYEFYTTRVDSGKTNYVATSGLGAFGLVLATLSRFFGPGWIHPTTSLAPKARADVLHRAGYCLQVFGRRDEAWVAYQAALSLSDDGVNDYQAAKDCRVLSEMALTRAHFTEAAKYAKEGRRFAEETSFTVLKMQLLSAYADALSHARQHPEPQEVFDELDAELETLYSKGQRAKVAIWGYNLWDMLLDEGKAAEVKEKVNRFLPGVENQRLLAAGLCYLLLARAGLVEALRDGARPSQETESYVEKALDFNRRSGSDEFVVRSLLIRASLKRCTNRFDAAQKDIDDARDVAHRGGMHLNEMEVDLEQAELLLVRPGGDRGEIAERVEKICTQVSKSGYGRREGQAQALKNRLASLHG